MSIENDILIIGISIYPNPASRILNISKLSEGISIKSTKLFDITGKAIYSAKEANTVDVSNYARGLYILKLESQEGGLLTKKVILK